MLIIVNSVTGQVIKNYGKNDAYPNSDIPGIDIADEQMKIIIPDDSELANKIMSASPGGYNLVFDSNNNVVDVIVTKTLEQYWQENPPAPPEPTSEEKIAQFEQQLAITQEALDFLIMGGM